MRFNIRVFIKRFILLLETALVEIPIALSQLFKEKTFIRFYKGFL